jgi:hypothetical protein
MAIMNTKSCNVWLKYRQWHWYRNRVEVETDKTAQRAPSFLVLQSIPNALMNVILHWLILSFSCLWRERFLFGWWGQRAYFRSRDPRGPLQLSKQPLPKGINLLYTRSHFKYNPCNQLCPAWHLDIADHIGKRRNREAILLLKFSRWNWICGLNFRN